VPRLEALEDRTVPSGGYVFQTIDAPGGAQGTEPIDVNSAGKIVGYYVDASGVTHGYLQIGSQFTTIDPPNESTVNPFSLAGGINAAGQIVGVYIGTDGLRHGYLLSGGQYTTLDDPLAVHGTRAFGINAQGQITGFYRDANFTAHGFLLSHGQYIPVDDPNAGSGAFQGTLAFAINASGQITGLYIDANNFHHSFLLSGGQYTTVDDPLGALGTEGSGINDRGQIVGGYFSADGQTHAYLQTGSQFTTVDDPVGVGFSYADGINDTGQIVGVYLDATGFQHGFLATPTQSNSASIALASGSENLLVVIAAFNRGTLSPGQAMSAAAGYGANGAAGLTAIQTMDVSSVHSASPGDQVPGHTAVSGRHSGQDLHGLAYDLGEFDLATDLLMMIADNLASKSNR
jgi:probable HAF family extracellular repeat protein